MSKVCCCCLDRGTQSLSHPFQQESRCIKNFSKCHRMWCSFSRSQPCSSSPLHVHFRRPRCISRTRKGDETKATRKDPKGINFPRSQNTDSGVFIKSLCGVSVPSLFIRFGILREVKPSTTKSLSLSRRVVEVSGEETRSHTL
jgi:hypothetical protein